MLYSKTHPADYPFPSRVTARPTCVLWLPNQRGHVGHARESEPAVDEPRHPGGGAEGKGERPAGEEPGDKPCAMGASE